MACRPNRSTGSRTRIAVQEEPCWGTVSGTENAYGWDFTSETLRNDITNIDSNIIRSDRMRSAPTQGNHRPGGDVNGELQPHGPWPLILKHVLGQNVVTTGSNPYTHTLQGESELPDGLTVEKRFGFPDGTWQWLQYIGCRVNEFNIAIPLEGQVTARAGLLAKQEKIETADMDADPTYPTDNEPFNTFHGSINMDLDGDGNRTAIATVTNLDMTISNTMDGDQFAIDGLKWRADLPEDQRVINGSLSAFFTDTNWQLYEAFVNDTTLSIDFTLARGAYSWAFTLYNIKIRGNVTPQVGGRGPLNLEMQYEAFRDEVEGTDIQVVVTNADAVLSTAA